MNLRDKRILITGAAGEIGREICKILVAEGAQLCISGRSAAALVEVENSLETNNKIIKICADLSNIDGARDLVHRAIQAFNGKLDIIIHCAALSFFSEHDSVSDGALADMLNVNLLAPQLMAKAALPHFKKHNSGTFVCIGSILGSIGFGFSSGYSASKFGLRGFCEALRRELRGSNIKVTFISPRAVQTKLNSAKMNEFIKQTRTTVDQVPEVARRIVIGIKKQKNETYLGLPESIFVKLNSIAPRLVDWAISGQMKVARTVLTTDTNAQR